MVMVYPNVAWIASLAWIFFIVAAWEMVWKGIALWRSGNNKQLVWFVCIFIFNTLGILPLVYLIWFQKKSNTRNSVRKHSSPSRGSRTKKKR